MGEESVDPVGRLVWYGTTVSLPSDLEPLRKLQLNKVKQLKIMKRYI